MKIGIIKEGKTPPDSRVPLDPQQCRQLIDKGIDIVVQKSDVRCYPDQDYIDAGVPMSDDMSDREILLGVKEVPIDLLLNDKTYFFFSHTIKEQAYNQKLLRTVVDKRIRLIDYEVLTDSEGRRVIAFGKYAGMVGAHNAIWTYGMRTKLFSLPRMKDMYNYKEAKEAYNKIEIPNIKIVLTGTGRVSNGAAQVLNDMGLQKVSPDDYITKSYSYPVYAQIDIFNYAKRKDQKRFDDKNDFFDHPEKYESDFEQFLPMSDVMINGIYWDNAAPAFFTVDQMHRSQFGIKVIADVTCDIAPVSSIPSTLRASTIDDPVFGFDPATGEETGPFQPNVVDMMTIDNLPNEMPRDASTAFGDMFIEYVIPQLKDRQSQMIDKATIAVDGNLGSHFEYLRSYLEGR